MMAGNILKLCPGARSQKTAPLVKPNSMYLDFIIKNNNINFQYSTFSEEKIRKKNYLWLVSPAPKLWDLRKIP